MGYDKICEAKTKEEMQARFAVLLSEVAMKFGEVDEELQKSNVGYFAGYYDNDTRERVFLWLKAEHPIFGRSLPSPEEALKAGKRIGKTPPATATRRGFRS